MCEDTADPQVDNFWPWTEQKNNVDSSGTQAFRSGTDIAAPRDGIPTSSEDAATDTIPDTVEAATPDTAADRRYGMHEVWSNLGNVLFLSKSIDRNFSPNITKFHRYHISLCTKYIEKISIRISIHSITHFQ